MVVLIAFVVLACWVVIYYTVCCPIRDSVSRSESTSPLSQLTTETGVTERSFYHCCLKLDAVGNSLLRTVLEGADTDSTEI